MSQPQKSIDNRYQILEEAGKGGMVTVYKAFDKQLERYVVVLVSNRSVSKSSLNRFKQEAKILANSSHPNIVQVLDYGEQNDLPYLVMEYASKGTLKDKLGKPIPWREAIQIIDPIAHALEHIHKNNIIHRDIKPSNILFTASGQPILSDFGIEKILQEQGSQESTDPNFGLGTLDYMAPEQLMEQRVDFRSDIYSLGIVLYEMVTGQKPFVADSPMAVAMKHIAGPVPRPSSILSSIPESVEKTILKALAKNPDDRFQNMGEFITALEKELAVKEAPLKQLAPPAQLTTSTQSVRRESLFRRILNRLAGDTSTDAPPPDVKKKTRK